MVPKRAPETVVSEMGMEAGHRGESRGRLEGRWQRGLTLLKAWAQARTLLATNRR